MPRFAEVAERFLEAKHGKIRNLTLKGYTDAIATYLLPYFGYFRLNKVSVSLIERLRAELRDGLPGSILEARAQRLAASSAVRAERRRNPRIARPVDFFRAKLKKHRIAARTINGLLTLLVSIFNYAAKHRLVTFNPAEHVEKLPPMHRENVDQNVLTGAEVKQLLEACTSPWRLMIEVAVTTGLRQSELLGLQWGDIDWQANRLHVRRALRQRRFYDCKSKHSRRIVELPPALVHALKVWRLECPKGAHDLVFPNSGGQPQDAPNLIHYGFEPALRRAGLRKIRFHDLRHTAASLLLANGVDVVAASRLLGHSSPIVTLNVYSHAIPKERAGLTDKLANLFCGASSSSLVANCSKSEQLSVEADRKLLNGLVGHIGLEPITNGLRGADPGDPELASISESKR
jgi:integrase